MDRKNNAFLTIMASIILVGTIIIAGAFGNAEILNLGNIYSTDASADFAEQFTDKDGTKRGGAIWEWVDDSAEEHFDYIIPVFVGNNESDIVLAYDTGTEVHVAYIYWSIPNMASFWLDKMDYSVTVPRDTSSNPSEYYNIGIYAWGVNKDNRVVFAQLVNDANKQTSYDDTETLILQDNIRIADLGANYIDCGMVLRIQAVGTFSAGDIFGGGFVLNGTENTLYPSALTWEYIIGAMGICLIIMAVLMVDVIDLPSGISSKRRGR